MSLLLKALFGSSLSQTVNGAEVLDLKNANKQNSA
jgi:hypothetical protein